MLFGKHVNKFYIRYGLFFLIGIAALVAVDYFQLEIPKITGQIIDGLTGKIVDGEVVYSFTTEDLKGCILQLLMIAAIMFAGRFLWRICIFGNGIKIECDLRNDLFNAMEKQSQKFFGENKTGALMALYTNDLNQIRQCFGGGTIMLVDSLCLGVFTLIRMFQLNWMLTIVSLVTITVTIVFAQIFEKRITKATDANFAAYERLSDYVQEDFSGISVVKAFTKEELQIRHFQKYNQDNMDTNLNMVKESAKFDSIIMVVINTIFILTIVYSAILVYLYSIGKSGEFTIGNLAQFLAYFDTLIWPIDAFGRLFQIRGKGKASLGRISNILENELEVNDNLVSEETKDVKGLKGLIEYKDLTFNYPSVKDPCLKNVSFKINPGEFVGIIGATGSGKTTIVDLLLRVYNVEEGRVFIDGYDIMHLPLATVRGSIAYVPQDNFLFSDTVANNIAFSENGEIDEEKVEETAKLADVYKDVINFNDKMNTVMGERGVTVSGGQKQRISIARALYKDANILILDDSLSAVDTETEKAIIHNLREIRKGRTTIIIAHRISTLQHLDKILVIEDGTVTGIGKHEELLKTNIAYAKEARLQELEAEVGEKHER